MTINDLIKSKIKKFKVKLSIKYKKSIFLGPVEKTYHKKLGWRIYKLTKHPNQLNPHVLIYLSYFSF